MKIQVPYNCHELAGVDSPPVPQTHICLAALEYDRLKNGRVHFEIVQAIFWAGLIGYILRRSRDHSMTKTQLLALVKELDQL